MAVSTLPSQLILAKVVTGSLRLPTVLPITLLQHRITGLHRYQPNAYQKSLSRQAISYLARDYATFGRLQLSPTFTGASPAQLFHRSEITGRVNVPALVRPQPLYILLRVQQGPVFLINSRQGFFSCVLLLKEERHIPKLRLLICRVPSGAFTRSPQCSYTNPPVSV